MSIGGFNFFHTNLRNNLVYVSGPCVFSFVIGMSLDGAFASKVHVFHVVKINLARYRFNKALRFIQQIGC